MQHLILAMASFKLLSLPIELINRIVFYVPRRSDLATLRLTSQTLNTISTPYYFATVPIYPDWEEETAPDSPFPNAIEYTIQYFANILDSDKLKRLVRKVEIYMCNPDCVRQAFCYEVSPSGCLLILCRTIILTAVCNKVGCRSQRCPMTGKRCTLDYLSCPSSRASP
jgi:hypothetical protein